MLSTVLTVSVSFALSLFLTPLAASVSKKLGIYDIPGGRKSHDKPTPLLGGLAIFVSAMVSIAVFGASNNIYAIPVLIVGASGITFMGLVDDIVSLSAKRRMVILFCTALIVFFGCLQYYFSGTQLILPGDAFTSTMFSAYIIVWIVGVTNAVNFSDGLDGLAGYLSLIASISFAVIFSVQGRASLLLTMTLSLSGALAGFIPYNRNPAMLFMGDAGSMFIGFIMSLFSIASIAYETTLLAVIVPVFILFVPLLDMFLSILRRRASGRSAMEADHAHFHHRLHDHFHNQMTVVIILSLIQTASAGIGIYIFVFKQYVLGWIIAGAVVSASSVITVLAASRRTGKARA